MADELPAFPQNFTTGPLELVQVLERKSIRYVLIGGVATSYRTPMTMEIVGKETLPDLALWRAS